MVVMQALFIVEIEHIMMVATINVQKIVSLLAHQIALISTMIIPHAESST